MSRLRRLVLSDRFFFITCRVLRCRGALEDSAGGAYVPTVFVGMYATQGRYNVRASKLKRYYNLNHLRYLTTRTYRRARRFDSERFTKQWVATFGDLIRL
ncbi:MAG: hypothetical protein ABSF14_17075 [Terriglobia bacterium]|jgi:hypothetical protein